MVLGEHGFNSLTESIGQYGCQTVSVGVCEALPAKGYPGWKLGKAKVRVCGHPMLWLDIIAKAKEVAEQLDAGTYSGPKTVKV